MERADVIARPPINSQFAQDAPDEAGELVGVARTGVTVIMPRGGDVWRNPAFAAAHSFNGCGEMTGLLWIEESGQLSHPIALTSTHHVGTVHEALVAYAQEHGHTEHGSLPVVGETWDGLSLIHI